MKLLIKKNVKKKEVDDTLYGLLLAYRAYNSYFRILINEEDKLISFQMTNNPKNWNNLDREKYSKYRLLSRIELSANRLFVKYIEPKHLVFAFGEQLGITLPKTRVFMENSLEDPEKGYYLIESNTRHLGKIVQKMRKIINLSPQRKYGIIEKYFSDKNK